MRKRSRSRSQGEDKADEPVKPAFSRRHKREGGGFSDKPTGFSNFSDKPPE